MIQILVILSGDGRLEVARKGFFGAFWISLLNIRQIYLVLIQERNIDCKIWLAVGS